MRKMTGLAAGLIALAGLFPTPARASTTVHLDVQLGGIVPVASCDVAVGDGANGVAVLDGAVASGCIESYELQTNPQFGEFVRCIDHVCGAPDEAMNATYWAIYVDGAYALTGVSGLSFPADGSTLAFSYEQWLTGYVQP